MKHWIVLTFLAVVLAGCGGSSNRVDELETELEEAKQKADEAEAARQREAAARQEAERQAAAERERTRQEAAERAQAEQEAEQREQERDEAQQKLNRFVALEIVTAISDDIAKGSIAVPALTYRQPALVTVTGANFTSTSTGSSGGWATTTRTGSSEQRRDFAEIYSNVEAPFREDIRDHSLGTGLTPNEQGRYLGTDNHINITTNAHGAIAASSRFPRPSTQRQGELETFTVTDRGPDQTEKDAAIAAKAAADQARQSDPTQPAYDTSLPDYRLPVRNGERYPERYSVDISGTLMGAPGTFRCAGTAAGGTCSVDLSGPSNYVFAVSNAEWQFIPTSATSKVIIPDAEYMWFGWWKREPIETTPNAANAIFGFASNYGGMNPQTSLAGATGSATYEGSAIGYYAFYDIEAAEDDRSRSGRFQAKATLTADFGDGTTEGTLSGSITDFDTEPTWAVTLKSQTIASGAVAATTNDDTASNVSWSIRGLPRDGGQWEAAFYSNFESPAATAQPTGVAGAFTAQYGDHRKMIGSFGAERD